MIENIYQHTFDEWNPICRQESNSSFWWSSSFCTTIGSLCSSFAPLPFSIFLFSYLCSGIILVLGSDRGYWFRTVLGRVMTTVGSFRLLMTCFSSRFMELQMCFRWGAMDGHRWIFSLFSLTSPNNVTFVVFMLIFVMEGLVQTYSSRFNLFFFFETLKMLL